MLAFRPIDTHKCGELGLRINFSLCHSSLLNLLAYWCRGWLCSREALIVESSRCCPRRHLSIRFGSKARPAARDSDLKHHVFGDRTRSSGTPLLAVIVGSQQKTSSATICTLPRLLPTEQSRSLRETTLPTYLSGSFYRDDAGEGGLHVSGQSSTHFEGPLPLHSIPQSQISTDWSTDAAVEIKS